MGRAVDCDLPLGPLLPIPVLCGSDNVLISGKLPIGEAIMVAPLEEEELVGLNVQQLEYRSALAWHRLCWCTALPSPGPCWCTS